MAGMRWSGMSRYSNPAFDTVPNAKTVHDQPLEAQRAVAQNRDHRDGSRRLVVNVRRFRTAH